MFRCSFSYFIITVNARHCLVSGFYSTLILKYIKSNIKKGGKFQACKKWKVGGNDRYRMGSHCKKTLWDYPTFKKETVVSKSQTSPDKFSNSSSERHSTNLKIGSAASSNNSNATNAVLQLAQQASLAAAALAFQQPKVLRYH